MDASRFVHYKTGFESVDKEHWDLLQQMNLVKQYIKANDKETALKLLATLSVAFDAHCVSEEKFMESMSFPYIDAHKVEHDRLRTKLKQLSEREWIFREVISDLEEIFVSHIDHQDMQLAEFVKKKNQ